MGTSIYMGERARRIGLSEIISYRHLGLRFYGTALLVDTC